MSLNCHLKYHDKQDTLYCFNCANSILTTHKKCPFNNHPNPIFTKATQKRLEMAELDIKCLYALNNNKENNNKDLEENKLFVLNTDHGQISSETAMDNYHYHENVEEYEIPNHHQTKLMLIPMKMS